MHDKSKPDRYIANSAKKIPPSRQKFFLKNIKKSFEEKTRHYKKLILPESKDFYRNQIFKIKDKSYTD